MLQKNIDKMIVGTALALAASALLPIAKSTLKPLAESGMEGGAELLNRAKALVQRAREEVEDIIAEAQFERMKRQFEKDVAFFEDVETK